MSKSQTKWWENDPYAEKMAIGVVLHYIDSQWTVARPLLGSPADKAGIVRGDLLIAVGGNPLLPSIAGSVIEKTLSFLGKHDKVEVSVLRAKKTILLKMSFAPLIKLLARDDRLGGAELGYCKSCSYCFSRVTGFVDCKIEGGLCSIPCMIA